jgi:FKBP-type peptidyl-prolyl cis-trans isomerase
MCELAEFFRPDLISINVTIPGNNYMGKFLLIFLILASANAFAEVNKWVDDQGRVHYSDQAPPPEVQAKALRSASENAASGVSDTSEPTYVEQEAALKRAEHAQQKDAAQAAAKQATADALKANCKAAQDNLRSLQSGARIMDINASGERYFIDDAERQQRIEKVQQDIGNLCK